MVQEKNHQLFAASGHSLRSDIIICVCFRADETQVVKAAASGLSRGSSLFDKAFENHGRCNAVALTSSRYSRLT